MIRCFPGVLRVTPAIRWKTTWPAARNAMGRVGQYPWLAMDFLTWQTWRNRRLKRVFPCFTKCKTLRFEHWRKTYQNSVIWNLDSVLFGPKNQYSHGVWPNVEVSKVDNGGKTPCVLVTKHMVLWPRSQSFFPAHLRVHVRLQKGRWYQTTLGIHNINGHFRNRFVGGTYHI
jgi:hypothetical protein